MKRENITKTSIGENNQGVSVANSLLNQQLTKIKGKLTSQIRQRQESKDAYYYAFIKLKGHGADLPVIFRIKDEKFTYQKFLRNMLPPKSFVKPYQEQLIKPNLEKGNLVELTGYYSHSDKNIRKSFTCSHYQVLDKKKNCSLTSQIQNNQTAQINHE